MKRRDLLKNLVLGSTAVMALPAWANGWSTESLPAVKALPLKDEQLLHQMVQALIPKTDTPGAGDLGADKFVRAILEAQHDEAFQQKFYAQLSKVDDFSMKKYDRTFENLSNNEKTECLGYIQNNEDSNWKQFFGIFKRYTIQGYMGSEYVMVNLEGYTMAPGYFHGCVPV